ncbi:wall-associated receptor kinase-like 14 [Phoenix dactylifera]|uniref:Wall-associated receptor kinase-like 14 n=1 Tax=Phoenix dactylifera TaxID=42345 RepID=A0A8B7C6E1_PHODC|nr:wall-associated receptor kinase-like 14 [Phoenix dactylifera]
MIPYQSALLPFLFLAAFSSILAEGCNRTCGGSSVPYPFGFSSGCPIRLNCNGTAAILRGGYPVVNITSETILLGIPANCTRPFEAALDLFGGNYAMTPRNSLFLRKCSSPSPACVISTEIISEGLHLERCGLKGDNISCYSDHTEDRYLSREKTAEIKCRLLFTSLRYSGNSTSQAELVFGEAELGWWMNGDCRCSANATCAPVNTSVAGKMGYRCTCDPGFAGDGFAAGDGCRVQVSSCSASKYISGRCARSGLLVAGIIAGALLMAGLAFLCHLFHRRRTASKSQETIERLLSEASCTIPVYSYRDIEQATDHFSDANRRGTGAYGTVYVGKLPGNTGVVAVKRIQRRDTDSLEQITNEIKLISSVSHPNLVRLLGCCMDRGEQILLYEFMPNGTLSQHLHGERGEGLSWTSRLSIAAETANAIAYLHSAVHPPIYHRDIKSSNILIDHNFGAKVADFGLSRIGMTESSHISTAPQGTPGYLDPQYHQDFHLSDKSDVYSFGVVLAEMITGMKAVDFGRAPTEVNLAALAVDRIGKGRMEEIIDPFIKVNVDEWTLVSIRKVAELAFRCLAFHKDLRPSMKEVAEELEMLRDGELDGGVEMAQEGKSRRLVLMSATKVDSPVSVQDAWLSEQSSSSTNVSMSSVNR